MFNEREKLILQVLLKNNEQLSIKEIAKATKIKERTLYREIKNLESSLQALDIDLIKEKSKYYLSGNIESLDSAQFETSFEDYAYSAETRLNLILCFIILNEDTSIKDISEKLMLSYNTVASIVPTIEKILEDYKLSLVRKKGQGIEIVGKEIDRRILQEKVNLLSSVDNTLVGTEKLKALIDVVLPSDVTDIITINAIFSILDNRIRVIGQKVLLF